MGLLEQIEQKAFLGTEFLTWLWARSEMDEGPIEIEGDESIEVEFLKTMTFEAQYGEATVQSLKGEAPGAAAEARAAVLEGKTVKRAKIKVVQSEMEWTFSLRGDTFDFGSIAIPAPKGLPFDEGTGLRLDALERLFALMNTLFETFLALRLDEDRWADELARIRQFVEPSGGVAD